ncbi:MAG: DUF4145 domain-containing protein [Acidobacteriota bacterium]
MIIKAPSFNPSSGTTVSLRCPACRQLGTFQPLPNISDIHIPPSFALGHRLCPNGACRAHVFFVYGNNKLIISYPAERIDFDTTNIPPNVVTAFEEALTCHANQCYVACAIMVRKTLEELCRDRGSTGNTLKDRLTVLGGKVVLPKELLDAMHDLRLLGNDAAHIESQEYNQVGQPEVEAGIAVTKEILKAVYQYQSLVSQLRALKKNP